MLSFSILVRDASKEEKLLADHFYKLLGRSLRGKKYASDSSKEDLRWHQEFPSQTLQYFCNRNKEHVAQKKKKDPDKEQLGLNLY